jgi:hypothetical protein
MVSITHPALFLKRVPLNKFVQEVFEEEGQRKGGEQAIDRNPSN